MGLLADIVGGGAGGIINGVANAVDKFVETPDEKAALALKKQALQMQRDLAQIDVNKVEAASSSLFVSGWRPAVGWICGFALGYHFILQPFLVFAVRIWLPDYPLPPPLDIMPLLTVLGGILGLGTMRMAEKMKGVSRS